MKKTLMFLACLAVAGVASASTILQFTQVGFNTPFVFSGNGTTTTLAATNVPIVVVFDPNFCLVVGCGGVTPGLFSLNVSATSTGPDTVVGTALTQQFSGSLSITQGATNLLSVLFSDLTSGSVGGSNPTMQASQPPNTFTGSSNVLDPAKLGLPRGFAFSFSNMSPGLASFGTSIRSGRADATGTFNATPVPPVPEPATIALFGTGLIGMAALVRRKRQQPRV